MRHQTSVAQGARQQQRPVRARGRTVGETQLQASLAAVVSVSANHVKAVACPSDFQPLYCLQLIYRGNVVASSHGRRCVYMIQGHGMSSHGLHSADAPEHHAYSAHIIWRCVGACGILWQGPQRMQAFLQRRPARTCRVRAGQC